jgi:hypothetical protein
MFEIYGDYATTDEALLAKFDLLSEAVRWVDGYIQDGFGGYGRIEVISFAADGEAVTWYDVQDECYEDDGQPDSYTEYQDLPYGGDDMFETCSYCEDY